MKAKVRALVEDVDQFIGVDHHKRTSYLTIKDRHGEIIKKGNIKSCPEALHEFLNDDNAEEVTRMAVMECGRTYRPMWKWLSSEVDRVVLAHPGGLKVISDTVYKDDKLDSSKLCDLLMLGVVPEAHPASETAWERRTVLRHRVRLVRMRTQVRNAIHVLVDLYPDALPRKPEMSDLFGRLGVLWLSRLELPDYERRRLDELLDIHEFFSKKIAASDSLVRKIVKEDERCRWLKTMPGIGDFFAALIVAEVDDIKRFPSPGDFASYIGLVPRYGNSAESERSGGMHKQGNVFLRWAFVEAAIPATRSNLALNDLYARICARRGKKEGPNVAKGAVAHKLATIAFLLLRDGRPYEV
jgi:transposase